MPENTKLRVYPLLRYRSLSKLCFTVQMFPQAVLYCTDALPSCALLIQVRTPFRLLLLLLLLLSLLWLLLLLDIAECYSCNAKK